MDFFKWANEEAKRRREEKRRAWQKTSERIDAEMEAKRKEASEMLRVETKDDSKTQREAAKDPKNPAFDPFSILEDGGEA